MVVLTARLNFAWRCFGLALIGCLTALTPLHAAENVPNGAQLVQQLRAGGYVLVMRHAQAPIAPPSAAEAEPENPNHERQLDAAGKAGARELGMALHALNIPIGPIYSSPAFRAAETVRLAQLGELATVTELAEGAQGMSGAAQAPQTAWLRRAVERAPPAGSNALIVTHTPNIIGAFGREIADIKPGEIIIFQPQTHQSSKVIARVQISQWQQLARP